MKKDKINESEEMKTRLPKVSLIMSVYNGQRYLAKALQSILDQTFKDFEFIIIDDGSKDKTQRILKDYSDKDQRIKIFQNQVNRGLANSLNRGIQLARGEYIARMDADDVSLPERIALEVEFLDHHLHVGLVGTGGWVINKKGKVLKKFKVLTDSLDIKSGLKTNNRFIHGSVMMRKSCLDQIGFYRNEFTSVEDYDLWVRISRSYDVANLEAPLYQWRVNPKAISVQARMTQQRLCQVIQKRMKDKLPVMNDPGMIDKRTPQRFFQKLRQKAHSYLYWSEQLYEWNEKMNSREYLIKAMFLAPYDLKVIRYVKKRIFNHPKVIES